MMRRTCLVIALSGGLGACRDATGPTQAAVAPQPPAPALTRMRVVVDVERGTMEFVHVPPAESRRRVSPARFATYGDQGVTVRLYNSPVAQAPGTLGRKTYTANVGVRNLLPHPIGDEQGAAAPADTMGIFIYFTGDPVVVAPAICVLCTVTVQNEHGTAAFDAPSQPYFYWKERLSAAGGGSDTTRTRRTWIFDASSAVSQFSFDVLVSAAWPPPQEAVWRVAYGGDSLPDTQSEPPWRRFLLQGTTTASAGILTLAASNGQVNAYYRSDSLSSAGSALVQASLRRVAGPNSATPQGGLLLDDDTRVVTLGISSTQVGFTSNDFGAFLAGGAVTVATTTARVYELRKFARDSVQLWIDGTRRITRSYAQFPASSATTLPVGVAMVVRAQGGSASLAVDYLNYQLGRATP